MMAPQKKPSKPSKPSKQPQPDRQAVLDATQRSEEQPLQHPEGQSPLTIDPGKLKIIQQHLGLILHTDRCRREMVATGGNGCYMKAPHCCLMKHVLAHMVNCSNGHACLVRHCSSSRLLIRHWKMCIRRDCPVCFPFLCFKAQSSNSNTGNLYHAIVRICALFSLHYELGKLTQDESKIKPNFVEENKGNLPQEINRGTLKSRRNETAHMLLCIKNPF